MKHSEATPANIGIIGCGSIFHAYAQGCRRFRLLNLKACADISADAAAAKSKEFDVPACSIAELLADPSIEVVINLTVPKVHASVSRQILEAGKHVYSEKPLALDTAEAHGVLELARRKGLRLGCAPDTVLGAGLQTARKLVDDGWIGRPLSGTAFMLSAGPESWHPNPAFVYLKGGGPLFDMGPYFITALVQMLGPVESVSAATSRSRDQRMITSKERFGEMMPVEVQTHYSASLVFESGAIITLVMSFDVHGNTRSEHQIEIYGSAGSLGISDPNLFGCAVNLQRAGEKQWTQIPPAFGYAENSRGIGVADMVHAIRSGRPHRCDGSIAMHVLEVMNACEESGRTRSWVNIAHKCPRPPALPLGLAPGVLDD